MRWTCNDGCWLGWHEDGFCDEDCNVEAYNWDLGDFEYCSDEYLSLIYIGDGFCDTSCYVEECNWDDCDCGICSDGCCSWWRGDESCDDACNVEACYWDHADSTTMKRINVN